MKERYYYLRRKRNNGMHRCGVVCLIKEAWGITARGVSICSELDPFSKTVGIHKAKGLALKALVNQENNYPIIRSKAIDILIESGIADPRITFRSEFNPIFTEFENEILRDKNE
jgi:hypothetical protein